MYVVVVDHKNIEPMSALMPELTKGFPGEKFSLHGSPDKGWRIHIEGIGDEKAPREFSYRFLKKWKPSEEITK